MVVLSSFLIWECLWFRLFLLFFRWVEAFCQLPLFLCTAYTSATVHLLANQGIMNAMVFTSIQKLFPLALLPLVWLPLFFQLSILQSVLDHLQLCSPHQVHLVLVSFDIKCLNPYQGCGCALLLHDVNVFNYMTFLYPYWHKKQHFSWNMTFWFPDEGAGKPLLPLDSKTEEHEEKERTKTVSYSYSFFHIIFSLASMYSAMLLTGWSTSVGESGKLVDVGWPSVWVRILTGFATAALYLWSLLAPILFPEREFWAPPKEGSEIDISK